MDGTRNALNRWSPRGSGIVYPNPLPFLEPRDFLAIVDHGAQPIDLREPMEFAASHLKGSLSLGLGADFEAWASSLLDPTHEYVLICNAGSEPEASLRLRPLLGFRMRGVLAGGMSAMEAFPERLDFLDARRRRARRLDVRPAVGGRRSQHRFPLEELLGRLDELPPAAEALDVCDLDPQRALSTASLLRRLGWANARPLPTPPRAARARILGS
jgi:rhodanese-related sulfurtransferase